jgi:hypothetical protein
LHVALQVSGGQLADKQAGAGGHALQLITGALLSNEGIGKSGPACPGATR